MSLIGRFRLYLAERERMTKWCHLLGICALPLEPSTFRAWRLRAACRRTMMKAVAR